jgi:hypothetical protein
MPFVRFALVIEHAGRNHFMITSFQVEHELSSWTSRAVRAPSFQLSQCSVFLKRLHALIR